MPFSGYEELDVKEFGGLNTLSNPTDLPQFMSPNCQNVEFVPGRVQTRPGTSKAFGDTFGFSSNINYTKSYQQNNGDTRNLAIDSFGNFFYEDVTFLTTGLISQSLLTGMFPNSVSLFGREWFALGDGKQGIDIPRQYNGNSLERISQSGPGAPPVVTDEGIYNMAASVSGALFTVPAVVSQFGAAIGIISITQSGNLVTVTLASYANFALFNQESVTIAGVTPSQYNGTFNVNWTPVQRPNASPSTFTIPTAFTYALSVTGLAAGTGGTAISNAAAFSLALPTFRNFPGNFDSYIAQFPAGLSITTAGIGVAGYNGTWTTIGLMLFSTPCGAFTCYGPAIVANIGSSGLANSSSGTLTINGSIVAGQHQVTVQFLLDTGYLTTPSSPVTWTAIGGRRAIFGKIATGPSNVVARYVSITPVSSGQFFYLPVSAQGATSTIIGDNSTTLRYFNFGDQDLLNGVNINDDFDLIELGEIAGIAEYNSRLLVWGMTNKIQNFINLGFDGGFSQDTNVCPLGWTPDATNYAGGGKAPVSVTGDAYSITGDASLHTRGLITQTAVADYLGNPILSPGIPYTLTFRAQKTNISTGAQLFIQLSSASAAYLQGAVINIGTQVFTNTFAVFSANCATLPTPMPSDLVLQVYATNLGAGEQVYVDCIEFFPTNQPVETSVIRFSNVEDAESFNGLTGFIQPTEENGQAIRNAFTIRDFLYIVKERSFFVTRDDGQNEPDAWELDEVSRQVGTPSPRGVGIGDEWVVIAAQSGLWLFSGGQLTPDSKISQEIQPTWDSINWNLGHLIDVKVDTRRKRIYVNVPLGASAAQNNTILTLDYTQGFGDPANADGVGRKWCPWTLSANSINLCLQHDNSLAFYVGANFGNGIVYKLDASQLNDYGTALTPINAYWESGYFQNGSRLDFGYLRSNAVGAGLLNLTLYKGEQVRPVSIRGWTLSQMGVNDMERQLNMVSKRVAVQFGQNAVGSFFQIQGFSIYATTSPWSPVRGINVTA